MHDNLFSHPVESEPAAKTNPDADAHEPVQNPVFSDQPHTGRAR